MKIRVSIIFVLLKIITYMKISRFLIMLLYKNYLLLFLVNNTFNIK